MTIEEFDIVYETTTDIKTNNEDYHLLSDLLELQKLNLHPYMNMDEDNDIVYELSIKDVLNSPITVEGLYNFVKNGWKKLNNKFIYKLVSK